MASMLRRALLYLGLGPDDDYDDYEGVGPEPEPERAMTGRAGVTPRHVTTEPATEALSTVRPLPRQVDLRDDASTGLVRRPVVRTVPAPVPAKPYVVVPSSFNSAQEVADKFKEGQPVIVNLQSVDGDLRRRLIDFASGLCYGLGGAMEKVANQVYLLTPNDVEVSAEDRRRLAERGSLD